MIQYDENNKFLTAFRDHGVLFFAMRFNQGDTFEVPSPANEPGQTGNVTILTKGKFRTYNTSREEPLDIDAGPGRIFSGLVLPGIYTLEGLESGTEYVCLSRWDFGLPSILNYSKQDWDFKLDNVSLLDDSESVTLVGDGHTTLVVCLWGEVTVSVDGVVVKTLTPGEGYEIDEGETVSIQRTAGVWSEVAWAYTPIAE